MGPENSQGDKQLVIAAMGVATTLLTSGILAFVQIRFEVALYSYMIWVLIPVGAMCSGFAAASGYYAGAKAFNQKPAGGVLFNMVAASLSAFFLVHYIPYYLMEVDGVRIKEFVSFGPYLDGVIRNTSMESIRGKASTGELGRLGYFVAFLQAAGFALGGASLYGYLLDSPFCERCARYLSKIGRQTRYHPIDDAIANQLETVTSKFEERKVSEAIVDHARLFAATKETAEHQFKSEFLVHKCDSCGEGHARLVLYKRKGTDWSELGKSEAFTREPVALLPNP